MFDTFRMRCPVLAMIGGLEQVEGFSELVERLPAEQVRKRMGQRFPLVPDLSAGEVLCRKSPTPPRWSPAISFPR